MSPTGKLRQLDSSVNLAVSAFLLLARAYLPEGLPDHVLVGDAVVGQCLAPDGVQRVAQGLSSKFIGLQKKKGRKREAERREGELIRNT